MSKLSNFLPQWRKNINLPIVCLATAIVCMIFGLFGYRHNLTTAYSKERLVLEADQKNSGLEAALNDLRQYSEHHMHADVSFWLEHSYARAVVGAHDSAATAQIETLNGSLYQTAQSACGERTDSVTKSHCIIDYIHSHQPAESQLAAKPEQLPSKADYSYNFLSPSWSWDGAGIAFALGGLSLVSALVMAIRQHKK